MEQSQLAKLHLLFIASSKPNVFAGFNFCRSNNNQKLHTLDFKFILKQYTQYEKTYTYNYHFSIVPP